VAAQSNITVGDIMSMLPFQNSLVELPVEGALIRDMFENVAAGISKQNGKKVTSTLQLSGIRGELDMSRPVYQRITRLEIESTPGKWIPLTEKTKLILISIDYIFMGGDAILPFPHNNITPRDLLADIARAHIEKVKQLPNYVETRLAVQNGTFFARS
jgi:5'-nucleotidase